MRTMRAEEARTGGRLLWSIMILFCRIHLCLPLRDSEAEARASQNQRQRQRRQRRRRQHRRRQ